MKGRLQLSAPPHSSLAAAGVHAPSAPVAICSRSNRRVAEPGQTILGMVPPAALAICTQQPDMPSDAHHEVACVHAPPIPLSICSGGSARLHRYLDADHLQLPASPGDKCRSRQHSTGGQFFADCKQFEMQWLVKATGIRRQCAMQAPLKTGAVLALCHFKLPSATESRCAPWCGAAR